MPPSVLPYELTNINIHRLVSFINIQIIRIECRFYLEDTKHMGEYKLHIKREYHEYSCFQSEFYDIAKSMNFEKGWGVKVRIFPSLVVFCGVPDITLCYTATKEFYFSMLVWGNGGYFRSLVFFLNQFSISISTSV